MDTDVDLIVVAQGHGAWCASRAPGLALYLFAIVSFSFWFRGAIGIATWRWIHRAPSSPTAPPSGMGFASGP
ncbi:MAG: hypothetical protein C4321_07690, partial [Chloroflexota bacterium]